MRTTVRNGRRKHNFGFALIVMYVSIPGNNIGILM